VLVAATSALALRTGLYAGWLALLGLAIAVALIAGSFFAPAVIVYLLLVWIVLVSATLTGARGDPSFADARPA
jgi:hypothetical protein